MTNEELNTALYKKMFAEQETYRAWLLSQAPEEILNHTYEYTVREDILMSLEYHDLTDAQARALLKSPSPLAEVFADWEGKETGYMDDMVCTPRTVPRKNTRLTGFRTARKRSLMKLPTSLKSRGAGALGPRKRSFPLWGHTLKSAKTIRGFMIRQRLKMKPV